MTTQIWCSAHQFGVQLPATPRGARQARQLAVEKLRAWGLSTDGPALIVAELAANAVTHGRVAGRDFLVVLSLGGGALRIEVVDTCRDRIPILREPDACAEGGRGLAVVAELADRWGVEQGPPPRKAVWAEVDLPTAGSPAGS
ncbi:ATP-binding protein [Streptomyces lavendulae]|uniref:ATP-binding protein n=1 Tax=Streptomyces lavendulae TaxID=1914 RepID=UPI0024A2B196|nr:ATP-binding protein [Streptomyces lavendulae subsp. lavendulae]GLX25614.1 ATP-binding protein [Streptomyces lavendulae subsp. lavendulae]